ncbi:histidine phosphatase family protein [Halovenus rubra]|uniref:phosphoglycerate mutase (2,3-diphosphoglycerate-dependent) n=2 Tax=Halovenus rubra TaxID=869890 RepID=A0ABD5X8B7_9EURY|nr:histidine phosphatase family protein [Halovenus rubra]
MTEIVLLRHGETEWDKQNRLHGLAPVPLTMAGRDAVESIGRELASAYEFDRVYTAGTRAARETIALVRLAGVAHSGTVDPAWGPREAGIFQGLAYEELELVGERNTPRSDVDVLSSHPRGGENHNEARRRVLTKWRWLCENARDETVLVVTHDFPIATVRASVAETSTVGNVAAYAPGKCSKTTVSISGDEQSVSEPEIEHGELV